MQRSGFIICVSVMAIIATTPAQAEGLGSFSAALNTAAKTATAVQNAAGAEASPIIDQAVKTVKGAADTSNSAKNADVAGTITNADKTATAADDLVKSVAPTEPVALEDGRKVDLASRNKKDLKIENCPANVHDYEPMALGTLGGFCQNRVPLPTDPNYVAASAETAPVEAATAETVKLAETTPAQTGGEVTGPVGGKNGYRNCPGNIVAPATNTKTAKEWIEWRRTPEGKCWMRQKTKTHAE